MNLWRRLRKVPESMLIGIGFSLFPWLPRRAIVGLSRVLGRAGARYGGRLRGVGLANLDLAFGDSLSADQKEAILVESFQTFTRLLLDVFWFGVRTRQRLRKWVALDPSFDLYLSASPALVATAHFGNWEVMGLTAALLGHPCVSVAAPLANSMADRIMNRSRRLTGQEVAFKEGAARAMLRVLRQGRNTALLVDQNTLPEDGGVFVPFFGLPVPVTKAVAVLARRTGATVVFPLCVAELDGSFTLHARDPGVTAAMSDAEIMQAVTRTLEETVRERPGQWLWMYKRWKFIPRGAPAERYPFYSRPAPAEGKGGRNGVSGHGGDRSAEPANTVRELTEEPG